MPLSIRNSSTAILLLSLTFLTGCATSYSDGKLTFKPNREYLEQKLCAGLYNIEQPFGNGSGGGTIAYYELPDGRKFENYQTFLDANERRWNAYVDQYARLYQRHFNKEFNRALVLSPDNLNVLSRFPGLEDLNSDFHENAEKFGMKPFVKASKERIEQPIEKVALVERLKGIDQYFVQQSDPNLCWAAVLETAFRYTGVSSAGYSQENFIKALNNQCLTKTSKSATLNQIVFAATDVHFSGSGTWMGQYFTTPSLSIDLGDVLVAVVENALDLDYLSVNSDDGNGYVIDYSTGQPLKNQQIPESGLFVMGKKVNSHISITEKVLNKLVSWTTTYKDGRSQSKGQLGLIDNVEKLIRALDKGYPVIAGLKSGTGGHTVLISGAKFYPGGRFYKEKNSYELTRSARLLELEYLDPTKIAEPLVDRNPDEFLSNLVFAFYIDNNNEK